MKRVEHIPPLRHGGNLTWFCREHNIAVENVVDLSTGINPTMWPVTEKMKWSSSDWQRLPHDEDGLVEAACAYYQSQTALPVAGSQQAIQTIPYLFAPCRVGLPSIAYEEHMQHWLCAGHEVYCFDEDELLDTCEHVDVILVVNPNNPTGKIYSQNELQAVYTKLQSKKGTLVVDEAFMDMTPEHSMAPFTNQQGLIVLRSLGKFFGLAGVRIGFVLAQSSFLTLLRERLGIWTLSGVSRQVAKAALLDSDWQFIIRDHLNQQSDRLITLLQSMIFDKQDIMTIRGTALFKTLQPRNLNGFDNDEITAYLNLLVQSCAKQGIYVRSYQQWPVVRFGLPSNERGWLSLMAFS